MGIEDVEFYIAKRQMAYIGHLARLPTSRIERTAISVQINGDVQPPAEWRETSQRAMVNRRINEIMKHTTVPMEKWKQCWANYAGATSEDTNPDPKNSKQRGKRWWTASCKALDEIKEKLDADTWRHRHSEEKEKLREDVRQVEQHRRMDGSVLCPKCGGRFNQLASHLQYCQGKQRAQWQERRSQHKQCPACLQWKTDMEKHKPFCKGRALTLTEAMATSAKRASSSTQNPLRRIRGKKNAHNIEAKPTTIKTTIYKPSRTRLKVKQNPTGGTNVTTTTTATGSNEDKGIRPLKQNKNWRYTGMVQKPASSSATPTGTPTTTGKAVRVRLRAPLTTLKRMSREPKTKKQSKSKYARNLTCPYCKKQIAFFAHVYQYPLYPYDKWLAYVTKRTRKTYTDTEINTWTTKCEHCKTNFANERSARAHQASCRERRVRAGLRVAF